jgi:hypothetical protein
MAIEKTTFIKTDIYENIAELYAWMQENASDLFDTIKLGSNNKSLTCYVTTTNFLQFFASSEYTHVEPHIVLGTANISGLTNVQSVVASHAYKTSKGFIVRFDSTNSPGSWTGVSWLYVFRTDKGTVGAAFCRSGSSSGSTIYMVGCDLEIDNRIQSLAAGSSIAAIVASAALTSLCPVPLGNGGSSPDGLFLVPFSELYQGNVWQHCIIDIGGTKYVYNGILAFEE